MSSPPYILDITSSIHHHSTTTTIRSNAEHVVKTGIIMAMFNSRYSTALLRQVHSGLDHFIREHANAYKTSSDKKQFVRNLVFPGGLWIWNGTAFVVAETNNLLYKRLLIRFREATRRKRKIAIEPTIPQAFTIVEEDHTGHHHHQQQQYGLHQQHQLGGLGSFDELVKECCRGDQRQTRNNNNHIDDDEDGLSDVSSITTFSCFGESPVVVPRHCVVAPPSTTQFLLPGQQHHHHSMMLRDDLRDPETVLRHAELNCLRVVCSNLREQVRLLELQLRAPPWGANSFAEMMILCPNDALGPMTANAAMEDDDEEEEEEDGKVGVD